MKDTGGTGNDVNEETRIKAIHQLSRNGDVGIRMAIALPVYSIEDVGRKIDVISCSTCILYSGESSISIVI